MTRTLRVAPALLLLLASTACVVTGPSRIVTREYAERRGLKGVDLRVAVDARADRRAAIEQFLARARARGARYVSDVEVHTASTERGEECTSGVVPGTRIEMRPVTQVVPGHLEARTEVTPVTRTVLGSEYRCRSVTKPVMKSRTVYASQYDFYAKSYRSVPRSEYVTENETKNECGFEIVTRTQTTHERRTRNEWTPTTLQTRYESVPVPTFDELETVCRSTSTPGSFVSGKIYGGR